MPATGRHRIAQVGKAVRGSVADHDAPAPMGQHARTQHHRATPGRTVARLPNADLPLDAAALVVRDDDCRHATRGSGRRASVPGPAGGGPAPGDRPSRVAGSVQHSPGVSAPECSCCALADGWQRRRRTGRRHARRIRPVPRHDASRGGGRGDRNRFPRRSPARTCRRAAAPPYPGNPAACTGRSRRRPGYPPPCRHSPVAPARQGAWSPAGRAPGFLRSRSDSSGWSRRWRAV